LHLLCLVFCDSYQLFFTKYSYQVLHTINRHTHMHTGMNTHTHSHTHTHTHTRMHSHTHTHRGCSFQMGLNCYLTLRVEEASAKAPVVNTLTHTHTLTHSHTYTHSSAEHL